MENEKLETENDSMFLALDTGYTKMLLTNRKREEPDSVCSFLPD